MKQNVLVGAGICVLIVLLSRLFGLRIADRPADKLTVEAVSFVSENEKNTELNGDNSCTSIQSKVFVDAL